MAYHSPAQEWLDGCCEWLKRDQHIDPLTSFPEFVDGVKSQLLQSGLHDSMMHGTGLDVHINRFTGNLKGPPVLVQITAISDIGISAFQLEQVRAAREERLMAGVGDEEGEEDGDVDVEGEGPMPKYPRGTLRLKLSDGATTLEAMEYRPLPQISLGPTPLGYKVRISLSRHLRRYSDNSVATERNSYPKWNGIP
jgi:RecQ mediated genome instability protein